jgi:hypothetical protein
VTVIRRLPIAVTQIVLLFATPAFAADAPIFVILWFDTEDYILPASDDAAKRLANWLTAQKIKATFKVVGEKARTLERRGRNDVIESLKKHEIGYHSNWHSVPPTPAQYLNELGWDDGVAEFDRRERPGFDDVTRIFGQKPTCYGQPGSSWGPQSFGALKNWGVPVYLDGGSHINLHNKPLYFCGLLTLYKIDIIRTRFGGQSDLVQTQERFGAARKRLQAEGGGIISIIYHPCEFVHKEFWDGVNFRNGANPPRDQWKLPRQKTPEETEAAFREFEEYMRFIQRFEDVRFITASDAAKIWRDESFGHSFTADDIRKIAAYVGQEISFQIVGDSAFSPSEVFALIAGQLSARLQRVELDRFRLLCSPMGPTNTMPTFSDTIAVSAYEFRQGLADVIEFIDRNDRIPSVVWLGSKGVPPEAFLAAAAKLVGPQMDGKALPAQIEIAPATLATTKYIADDHPDLWKWVIFPPGFRAPKVMEMAKRQAWTIKPARMIPNSLQR